MEASSQEIAYIDQEFIFQAIALATQVGQIGEGPLGALLIRDSLSESALCSAEVL